MTDKQIIIDGIDVGGCIYYEDGKCLNREMVQCNCKKVAVCYYKEYKRKEQECEKLETARHLIETSRYNWEYRAKSKERECESLNRWLPIISRLEMAFGSYEKAKAIDFASYTKQIFAELEQLKDENLGFKILHESDKDLLKRKEQECEELNKIIDEAKKSKLDLNSFFAIEATVGEYQLELDQLKAENEKYSLFIEKLCDYAGLECDSEEQAMRTLSDLASQMNKARWIIDRYKQTLAEIREIAENLTDDYGHKISDIDKILQKISEVE